MKQERQPQGITERTSTLRIGLSVYDIAILQEAVIGGKIISPDFIARRRIKGANAHVLNGANWGMQLMDYGNNNIPSGVKLDREYYKAIRSLVLGVLYPMVYPGRIFIGGVSLPLRERDEVHSFMLRLRNTTYDACEDVLLNASAKETMKNVVQFWQRLGIREIQARKIS